MKLLNLSISCRGKWLGEIDCLHFDDVRPPKFCLWHQMTLGFPLNYGFPINPSRPVIKCVILPVPMSSAC